MNERQTSDPTGQEAQPQWRVESFYLGSVASPSSEVYRSDGDKLQIKEAIAFSNFDKLDDEERAYATPTDIDKANAIHAFVTAHEDCQILVREGYDICDAYGGGHEPPSLWMVGWRTIATPEERDHYERSRSMAL